MRRTWTLVGLAVTLAMGCKKDGDSGAADAAVDAAADDDADAAAFDVDTMPLFDAHAHARSTDDIALLSSKGVTAGVVLQGTDTNGLQAQMSDAKVIAFAPIPANLDQAAVMQVQMRLNAGFKGVGEMSLRLPPINATAADDPFALMIYAAAANQVVTVHYDPEDDGTAWNTDYVDQLENALDESLDTTFIWAHMGDAQPTLVRTLIEAHDNLYADLSARADVWDRDKPLDLQSLTETDGALKADWKLLFADHPDRFLWGSDFKDERWDDLDAVLLYSRGVLAQVAPATAEKIGYQNAELMFGLR